MKTRSSIDADAILPSVTMTNLNGVRGLMGTFFVAYLAFALEAWSRCARANIDAD